MDLDDGTADAFLLNAAGSTLLIFTGDGCAACRWARRVLPDAQLPVDRLCWVDAGRNGGLVERYGVFHLPALFLVCDADFHGPVQASLQPAALGAALLQARGTPAEELP